MKLAAPIGFLLLTLVLSLNPKRPCHLNVHQVGRQDVEESKWLHNPYCLGVPKAAWNQKGNMSAIARHEVQVVWTLCNNIIGATHN